ncbi:hypothetical protein SNEBB_001306 [Seison nebaliae]|nr:hypothetical protein SNEBB_001306 [Seison nebaliae]
MIYLLLFSICYISVSSDVAVKHSRHRRFFHQGKGLDEIIEMEMKSFDAMNNSDDRELTNRQMLRINKEEAENKKLEESAERKERLHHLYQKEKNERPLRAASIKGIAGFLNEFQEDEAPASAAEALSKIHDIAEGAMIAIKRERELYAQKKYSQESRDESTDDYDNSIRYKKGDYDSSNNDQE